MMYRPFCSWSGKKFYFKDKVITILGAKDEGAIGNFQGLTMSLVLCDEITLYPESIIDMIDTRLSRPYSKGYATMNPSHPTHKVKKWIDESRKGNKQYFEMQFLIKDNPFLDEDYKSRIKESLSGLFYKRNYLGEWCIAEGSVFDFFDPDYYVVERPPTAAEYWIVGMDVGLSNAFAAVLIGVNTGQHTQMGKQMWVEHEYYWDYKEKGRQKTIGEFANDMQEWLEPYALRGIYIDPSALAMKLELRKRGMHCIDGQNEVLDGIYTLSNEMQRGTLLFCRHCKETIKQVQMYSWDPSSAKKGIDAPLKINDHAVDALRYAIHTHKVSVYNPYAHNPREYLKSRFGR